MDNALRGTEFPLRASKSYKICLVMILKNESKIIKRCIEACKGIIDAVCVTDTGSTDNTIQVVKDVCDDMKLPCKVYESTWLNFGHNRTESYKNAREWLLTNEDTIDKWYGLLLDADMILENRKNKFNVSQLHGHDSINLIQYNNSLSYDNVRLIRMKETWNCRGVTHEYWECTSKNLKSYRLETLKINDIGDGGAKADKFERDVRLLEQGIKDEPNNVRYYFYLAQSYRDSNNIDKAIELYQKRVSMGGWQEEVFFSKFMIAELYLRKGEEDKAVKAYLDCYEYYPKRIEPLQRLAKYYRLKGENNKSMIYCLMALDTPYPKDDVLFVEKIAYEYYIQEETSIVGYYTRYRDTIAYQCLAKLLFSKGTPSYLVNQSRRNEYHYMSKLNFKPIRELNFQTLPDYKISSTSMINYKNNRLVMITRSVNYSITDKFQYIIRDPNNVVRTENYWVELDMNYNLIKTPQLLTINQEKERTSHIAGLEDMRLFTYNKRWYFFATSFEYGHKNQPCLVVGEIDQKNYSIHSVKQLSYNKEAVQKNWAPFTRDGKLYAIYSYDPFIILSIDPESGECTEAINKSQIVRCDTFRGSASPIRVNLAGKEGYLVIIHEVHHLDTRKYSHRFLWLDDQYNIKLISKSFYFEEKFVEYVLGLVNTPDKLILTYSVRDNNCKIIELSHEQLNKQWLNIAILED